MPTTPNEIERTLTAGTKRGFPWLWALVALAVLGGAAFWLLRGEGGGAVSYVTEPVTRGALTVTVTATGTVQPTTEVEISSELSGTLASVEVDYNELVEQGQVLARLDDTKLKAQVDTAAAALLAARAQVDKAEATLDETREVYESERELDKRGVSTHRDFVSYEAAYRRAEADLEMARADLTQAEATLTLQQSDLDNAVIRSPITGMVLDRAAEAGQIVASSLSAPTLFVLAEDLTHMELQVDIDEADIGLVEVGQSARFTVDAYSGRDFPAEIVQVRYAPETTDGVVTYKGVLSVTNDDLLLRPGMTATATITVHRIDEALSVPNAALRYTPPQAPAAEQGGSGGGLLGLIMPHRPTHMGQPRDAAAGATVWVQRNGAPVEIEVQTGASDGRRTVIVSGDLAEGDEVITDRREAS